MKRKNKKIREENKKLKENKKKKHKDGICYFVPLALRSE